MKEKMKLGDEVDLNTSTSRTPTHGRCSSTIAIASRRAYSLWPRSREKAIQIVSRRSGS